MQYTAKQFNLPKLEGISEKQVKVHLALYEGYVKNLNLLMSTIAAYQNTDDEGGKYAIAEMRRRLGWEFDGMRLHEYYFSQFEGGPQALEADGALAKLANERYGEKGIEGHVRAAASARGIGWVIVYYDPHANTLQTAFVGDHELGQLTGLPILLALDLWEHSYMVDYMPAEKKNYIDAFFTNLNWPVIEKRFADAK